MNCPVCKEVPMITVELNDIEIDYCTECSGIWLDAGELELLLEGSQRLTALLDSFKNHATSMEKPRKCPICMTNMQKILVGPAEKNLTIDSCPKHHGLWFDRGELNEIVLMATLDKDAKIKKLLEDMFRVSGEQES